MWFVYVIKSDEEMIYTGMTTDLEKRLAEHNTKNSYFTKRGSNWKLIYSEECKDSIETRKRERYFKNSAGKEWLKRRGII